MKFLMSLLVFALPLSSWGVKWIERGNGGFVLRCPDKATQTFDVYEAHSRYGFTIDSKHSNSVEERVQYLISKLEKFNPSRAAGYSQWAEDFNKESRRIDNIEMFPVPDLGFGAKPRDCKIELTVFQRAPDILNRFRYAINQDLWNELDILNQAALIMHEIIYRELSSAQDFAGTSEAARYLNGILNSEEFTNLKQADYLALLQSLGFRNADYGGYSILLRLDDPKLDFKLEFYPTGGLVGAYLDNANRLYPPDLKINNVECYWIDSFVSFYPEGKTRSLYLTYSERSNCIPFYEHTRGGTKLTIQANQWKFFPDGGLMSALRGNLVFNSNFPGVVMLIKGTPFVLSVSSHQVVEATVELDKSGELLAFDLSRHNSCYDPALKRVLLVPSKGAIEDVLKFDVRKFDSQMQALSPCR